MKAEKAILEELTPGSKKLYFIFGGVAAGLAMPPFEFYTSAKIIEENKIFLRDFSQAWYQNGLPGVGNTFCAIGDFIEKKIAELEPEEVFFVGNSMGGYAAILFASLVGKGTAIAFAPQTFVSPLKRWRHREQRWSKQVTRMHLCTALKPHVWDLEAWLKTRQNGADIEIYVAGDAASRHTSALGPTTRRRTPDDEDSRLDSLHAGYLRQLASVTVHEFPVGGHNLVKQLRDEGALPAILSGTYRQPPVGTAPRSPKQRIGVRPNPQRPAVGVSSVRKVPPANSESGRS